MRGFVWVPPAKRVLAPPWVDASTAPLSLRLCRATFGDMHGQDAFIIATQPARAHLPGTRGCGVRLLLTSAVVLSLTGVTSARDLKVLRFTRPLSEAEAAPYAKALTILLGRFREEMAKAGRTCRSFDSFGDGAPLEIPIDLDRGELTPAGVVPLGLRVPLCCAAPDSKACDDYVDIRVEVSGAPLQEHGENVWERSYASLTRIGIVKEAREAGAESPLLLVIRGLKGGDAADSTTGPTVVIRFQDESRWINIASRLDTDAIYQSVASLAPIPGRRPCGLPEGPRKKPEPTAETAVIAALLEQSFGKPQLLVVHDSRREFGAIPSFDGHSMLAAASGLCESAVDGFRAALADKSPVAVPGRVVKLALEEEERLFAGRNGWERFRARYLGAFGIIAFSHAGFSADGLQAIIYVGWQRDWLEGRGAVYVLERRPSGWTVILEATVWNS